MALGPAQQERPRDAQQEEVQRAAPTGPDQEDRVDGRRDWEGGGGCARHPLSGARAFPGVTVEEGLPVTRS